MYIPLFITFNEVMKCGVKTFYGPEVTLGFKKQVCLMYTETSGLIYPGNSQFAAELRQPWAVDLVLKCKEPIYSCYGWLEKRNFNFIYDAQSMLSNNVRAPVGSVKAPEVFFIYVPENPELLTELVFKAAGPCLSDPFLLSQRFEIMSSFPL